MCVDDSSGMKGSGLSDLSGVTRMMYVLIMVVVPRMHVFFRTYRLGHQKG